MDRENLEPLRTRMRSLIDSATESGGTFRFEGGTGGEVDEVVARNAPFAPPDMWMAFMRLVGRRAEGLFTGSDLFHPGCLEVFDDIDSGLDGAFDREELRDLFIFGHHQGYQLYMFKRGDEAVREEITPRTCGAEVPRPAVGSFVHPVSRGRVLGSGSPARSSTA